MWVRSDKEVRIAAVIVTVPILNVYKKIQNILEPMQANVRREITTHVLVALSAVTIFFSCSVTICSSIA